MYFKHLDFFHGLLSENIKLVCPEQTQNDNIKIQKLLDSFELTEFADAYPNSISGGMKKSFSCTSFC